MRLDYILDTNIVSNLRKKKPHAARINWLASVPADAVFMTAATVTEIQCGIGLMQQPDAAREVQKWLDGMIWNGHPQFVGFDAEAALLLGKMWTTSCLKNFIANDPRSKKSKSGTDLTIAAIAITKGMVMVTRNTEDFLQINAAVPLPGLFNPLEGSWAVEPTSSRK